MVVNIYICIRFDEFGGTDDFTSEDVAYVLSQYGVLNFETDRSEEISQKAARGGVNALRLAKIRSGEYDNLSDDDLFED